MTTSTPPISARRAPLGRQFWTLAVSSGASNLADGIAKLSLPLVAVTFTRSPGLVAGLEVVRSLPWLLLALHAGAIVDRSDRRRAMLLANTVRAAAVLGLTVLLAVGPGGLWWLYLAAAVMGVAEVFHDTAAQTILPSLVDRTQLARANGRLYGIEFGAQQFIGPPLAGLLVSAGAALAFGAPTGLWILAIALLVTVRGTFRPTSAASGAGDPTSLLADIREGIVWLRGHHTLSTMAVMVGVTNLAASAVFPLYVLYAVGEESTLGLTEPAFGALLVVGAIGGLAGTVLSDRIEERLGTARTLTVSIVLAAFFIVTPALTSNVLVVAVSLALGTFGIMLWNIPTVSFRQEVVPDRLLGRLNSAYRLLAWGVMPIGAGLGGLLGELLGVRPVFAVMGLSIIPMLLLNRRITDDQLTADRAAC
jgi:MFS family permease